MWTLRRSVVMKRELSQKAKISIYQLIFFPNLTYGHKFWVVTERTTSRIQAAELASSIGWLSLRERVRSSATRNSE